MRAIKEARKFIESNPSSAEAITLSRLVLALESEIDFPITDIYLLDYDKFKLALDILQEWRLDRHFAGKSRLYDASLHLAGMTSASAVPAGAKAPAGATAAKKAKAGAAQAAPAKKATATKPAEAVKAAADQLHADLLAKGVDVILDDRGERPGAMFADWELIGVPHRVVLGDKGLKEGLAEYQGRTDAEATKVPVSDVLVHLLARLHTA